jgi:hypothetical protein
LEVSSKAFQHTALNIAAVHERVDVMPTESGEQARQRISRLGGTAAMARIDMRSGRFATLLPSTPLLPGQGVGNKLTQRAQQNSPWSAFRGYLGANKSDLQIDLGELSSAYKVASHGDGDLHQIVVGRAFDGIPVRDSYITGIIGQGNLTLLSMHQWGAQGPVARGRQISLEEAMFATKGYLSDLDVVGSWGKAHRVYVPMANDSGLEKARIGEGYTYRLVWSVKVRVGGDAGSWEALVDAHSGEMLAFADMNQYADARGGVLPVTNDGIVPDGVEQAGWPMPFLDVGAQTTDTGGNLGTGGSLTSSLAGTFIRMNDNCGSISLTQNDNLDFGTSGGTDCTTPGFGGAGNTHASRTGFYELNKIVEMARGQLPSNTWLQSQMTANMNINNTCNAFWNGSTVNFYRSGGGCFNTGEIAGVFDHEWGHGMDANDVNGGIASPSGEGIADIYTALRLNDSCIGRNFQGSVCSGNGDPCDTCTGVRDIDYLARQSNQPHDYTWSNANCGSSVHCIGGVYSEAVWSLWKRKLTAAPYNMDNNTAHEVVTRLTFLGAGVTSTWFSGGPPEGGCAGTSGYMNYLAADDDNGNLNDGTPHMQAIFDAFDDQEIACNTPTVQDSGCANTPTAAPNVTASPSDKSVGLSWGAVANATEYEVFRSEGVFACDFGKVRLGSTTGTTWNDSNLQNGRGYSYVVIPKGPSDSCFGPASSCNTVSPAAGPNLDILIASASTALSGGDGDASLDNCESGTTTFDVSNSGLGGLTNVRIVGVTPSNGGVTLNTSFPSTISASLTQGATGSGSFSYDAGGLSTGETLTFQVEVTADQLAASKFGDLDVASTEIDLTFTASQTYSFEASTEGWTTLQGTFNRSSSGGGAGGTSWHEQSSANLDNQCDQIQSPVMVLSATSTLSLSTNYDIEPFYSPGSSWYDRANIGVVAGGSRTAVNPDGGRLYNASGAQGTCGTNGQGGWADANTTWGSSSWSAGALGSGGLAGQEVQLDVRYGTDASLNGTGFRFDEVTVTDVFFQGPDTQSNSCSAGCSVDADCDDSLYCNGAETCNAGTCNAGTAPVCDDGVACTTDSCNEGTDSCDATPSDAACDNGVFCDGTETCDAVLGCQVGAAVNCDDGVGCTVDSCNNGTSSCDNTPDNGSCGNGVFCDGAEFCDTVLDCQAGGDPCPGEFCDEAGSSCNECELDIHCDDGLFCNGAETCGLGGSCNAGSDPCPGSTCDEAGDVCMTCAPKGASCVNDSECCSNKCKGKAGNRTCK